MKKTDPIMTVNQVAEYLGLPPPKVRHLARDGDIPAFKIGRQWRVNRERLDRWIAERSARKAEGSSA